MASAMTISGAVCLLLCAVLPSVRPDCNIPLATEPLPEYDFIIVGGGSAGATLAARLSEDEFNSVLLLEAGEDDRENFVIYTPAYGALTYGTFMDWNYTCEPNPKFTSIENNTPHFMGGKLLGGGSSINAMYYARGSKNDYNLWAEYTGDSSWEYEKVLPYFIKSESTLEERFQHSPYHGVDGGLYTTSRPTSNLTKLVLEAGEEAGYYVNPDYNGESQIGIGYTQATIGKGQRCPSSRAFLHAVLDRPNLDVIVRAFVTKINIVDNVATGVVVKIGDKYHNVTANNEVILSAGAIQSPKILMHSGIGPKDVLDQFQIPVIADLPVGKNLMDHIFVEVVFGIDSPIGWTTADLTTPETLMEYLHYHTGPLSSNMGGEGIWFVATKEEEEEIDWPDLQIHIGIVPAGSAFSSAWHTNEQFNKAVAHRDELKHGYALNPVLLRPKSRGHVTIRSTDPFDKPKIYPNYYDDQEDVERVLKGVRVIQSLLNTTTMEKLGAKLSESKSYFPCEHLPFDSDDFWRCQIISRPQTINHPSGTAKMGPKDDPTTVVDSECRVHGIGNLRVIDASIIPYIVAGNTNAPVIMVAEKMADIIRQFEALHPFQL